MFGYLRTNRAAFPFICEMLLSVLVFPCTFRFLENLHAAPDNPETSQWLCAAFITLGFVRILRGFRMREQSLSAFIANLIYGVVFIACGVLAAVRGYNPMTHIVITLAYLSCLLSDRVLAIVRKHTPWRIFLNVVSILIIIALMSIANESFMIVLLGAIVTVSTLLSIMTALFSRIRVDILKDIIQKTYALEIIAGLGLMMIAFSYVLTYTDEAFPTFWDALWYCFAIVTTIGFGDLAATSAFGRMLSAILGIYGIVVVALITSIIVNFYGELKKESNPESPANRFII